MRHFVTHDVLPRGLVPTSSHPLPYWWYWYAHTPNLRKDYSASYYRKYTSRKFRNGYQGVCWLGHFYSSPFQGHSPVTSLGGSTVSKRSIEIPSSHTILAPNRCYGDFTAVPLPIVYPKRSSEKQLPVANHNCSHSILLPKPFASFYSNTLQISCQVLPGAAPKLV